MLQTLKLNNKKWKKSSFYEEKSLVGLTPDVSEQNVFKTFEGEQKQALSGKGFNLWEKGQSWFIFCLFLESTL